MKLPFYYPILSFILLFSQGCEKITSPVKPTHVKPKIYVANTASNSLSVIDPELDEVINTIELGFQPDAFAYSESFKLLFIAHFLSKKISILDVQTDEVINLNNS